MVGLRRICALASVLALVGVARANADTIEVLSAGAVEPGILAAAEAFKKANKKLTDDVAVIPIVARNGVGANKKNLVVTGTGPWSSDVAGIAFWYRK